MQRTRAARAVAVPAAAAWSALSTVPALAHLQAQALRGLDTRVAGFVPRVFTALQQHALTATELAEAWGTTSTESKRRIHRACQALVQAQLVVESADHAYQVNTAEIERLRDLATRVAGAPAAV